MTGRTQTRKINRRTMTWHSMKYRLDQRLKKLCIIRIFDFFTLNLVSIDRDNLGIVNFDYLTVSFQKEKSNYEKQRQSTNQHFSSISVDPDRKCQIVVFLAFFPTVRLPIRNLPDRLPTYQSGRVFEGN